MPSATATAAPEEEPPGIRAAWRSQIGRRPVMRIDAQTGIGELRHRRFANHHRAGLQQPFHYRSVFSAAGASANTREPAVVTSPATSNRS